MAALASIATVVGAGASIYGNVRQAQAAKAMNEAIRNGMPEPVARARYDRIVTAIAQRTGGRPR